MSGSLERYRGALAVVAVGAALGAVFLVVVGLLLNFKAGIAVGGTFWATGAFFVLSALPERRRH